MTVYQHYGRHPDWMNAPGMMRDHTMAPNNPSR
jgi:hypothetical protein